jgi:DNA-binding MarR family transcriptional regulator
VSGTATPEEILRALADPERLAVAGALARRPMTAKELAEQLDLSIQRVRRHLNRLTGTGVAVAEADRRTFRLQAEALREAAQEIGPPRDAGLALGAVYEEEEAVLRNYFRGGRLREIPAKQSKRLIILTRLSLEFEPGVRYSEREVNATLRRLHDDYASLRRYLVDEKLLTREKGQYWRSGGPVEP